MEDRTYTSRGSKKSKVAFPYRRNELMLDWRCKLSFVVLTFVFILSSHGARSQPCPAARQAFEMTSTSVSTTTNNPVPGDTIGFGCSFIANFTGPAHVKFHAAGIISALNSASDQWVRDTLVQVDSGYSYSDSTRMIFQAYGGGLLSAVVTLDSAWEESLRPNLAPAAGDYISIIAAPNSFLILGREDTFKRSDTLVQAAQSVGSATLNISGKVTYTDVDTYKDEGVWDASVFLVFLKPGVNGAPSDGSYYHPFASFVEGTHSVKVAEDGGFSFSFNGPADWSQYSAVQLLVTQNNSAVQNLESAHTQFLYFTVNGQTWGSTFFPISMGSRIPMTNSQVIFKDDVKITVDPVDGAILRYLKFGQKFAEARGTAVPGAITAINMLLPSGIGGYFKVEYRFLEPNYAHIEISPAYSGLFPTIAHEYGHYQQYYNMNISVFDQGACSHAFKEGFAEFYQFAVRQYGKDSYGQESTWWDDNLEEAPFESPRFYSMRYWNDPDVCKFGTFVWNVYDKYEDPGFKYSLYAGDNDDVGLPNRVFDILDHFEDQIDVTNYVDQLYLASSSELSSLGHIYDFMFTGTNYPMRPAQVKKGGGVCNQMPRTGSWTTYPVWLYWENQYYTSTSWPVVSPLNPATGIRIYQSDGSSGWNLIATLARTAVEYRYEADKAGPFTYKVTAYNDGGDSREEQVINCTIAQKGNPLTLNATSALQVFPNPFGENISITCSGPTSFQIVDVVGKVRMEGVLNPGNDNVAHLRMGDLPEGAYFLRSRSGSSIQSLPITKTR